jgi:purine nucleosidase
LVAALEDCPEIKEKIEEVVWMAGAIDVPGNVFKFDHDKTSEWNIHWDAISAKKLFASGLNITIFPLDVTNTVPIDRHFLELLATNKKYNITDIVGQFYAITFVQSQSGIEECYMWDTLFTSFLGCDRMTKFRRIELDVDNKRPGIGRTIKAPGSGNWVNVACQIDKEKFFRYYLETLKVNGSIRQSN